MADYTVNPEDATSPVGTNPARKGAEEFRRLKERVNVLAVAVGVATSIPDFKNRLINPNLLIDQVKEGGLYSVAAATVQGPDGWSGTATGAGTFTMRILADPDFPTLNCIEVACTVADVAIAAGDKYFLFSAIEGYDTKDLLAGTVNAQEITITIPIKMNVTGNYGISIRNSAANRSYVGNFTQLVAGVREIKTITLRLDITGVWAINNTAGLILGICLAGGATFQTAGNAWAAGDFICTATQTNFMSLNTNIGYIGRPKLEKGNISTNYEPINFDADLIKIQRYYWKTFLPGTVPAQAAGLISAYYFTSENASGNNVLRWFTFPRTMRAAPTIITYNPVTLANTVRDTATGADRALNGPLADGVIGMSIGCLAAVNNASHYVHITANARLS